MCGIAGIAGSINDGDKTLVRKMTRLLAHRGPDDEDFHFEPHAALGHRRLSVIDLESGRQPLCNEDGTLWVVFNGEIYNFQELQKDLQQKGHVFKTRTDTEVIVHLYEEYPDFIQKLDGMFAFALWDGKKKQMILGRDRMGKKPLFYSHTGGKLYFASELKSMAICPDISRDWNPEALHHFLSLNYIPGPLTLLKSVYKVKPGHFLAFRDNKIEEKGYWQIPAQNTGKYQKEGEILEELKTGLLNSVKKRLISDVPLGMFLSGGIDSSLVLAALNELGHSKIKTFTIGFKDKHYDEAEKAKTIARHFGTDHHEFILEPNLADLLPKIIWHSDEPSGDSSCFPTYLLSQMARKNITVALSGDGGDEFFGGYNTYTADAWALFYRRLPLYIRKNLLLPMVKMLPSASHPFEHRLKRFVEGGLLDPLRAHYFWNGSLLEEEKFRLYSPEMRDKLSSCDTFNLFQELSKNAHFKNPMDLFMFIDQKTYLTDDILVKVDRMSMAHGLEVRSPLLDSKMIELSYQIPHNFKIRRGEKKYILKKLLSAMIPSHLFSKEKKGFSIPVQKWFRGELKNFLRGALRSETFTQLGFFDNKALDRLFNEHLSGKSNHGNILWSLMCLSIWNDRVRNLNGGV
jgi:asparagine synthase (glutamine-hydrolysing)